MNRNFTVALLALSFLQVSSAKKPPAISAEELAKITERGRMLADADAAASIATDVVLATKPMPGSFKRYVAQKLADGWHVAFGHWNESKEKFLVIYETTQPNSSTKPDLKMYDPPLEDHGFYLNAAKAIDLALLDFKGACVRYNVAVLLAGQDGYFVYLVPAQTQKDVYPYGGDVRYLISSDGTKILEKRQLHRSVLEFRPQDSSGKTVAGFHTHVLSDSPEDTDVFYVLTRRPPIGEFIGSVSNHIYEVKPDGAIVVSK